MSQAIVMVSGKGGTGKSTLTCALGRLLAKAGKRVVLLDMDMGMRSLDLMLGAQDRVVYDLVDVVEGICSLKQALIKLDDPNLNLINASQLRGSDATSPARMDQIVQKLKSRFDYVLIDCPAGVGKGFANAISGADKAILVTTPDAVSMRDAERVAGLLMKHDIADRQLVINRMPNRRMDDDVPDMDRMQQAIKIPLLGWVPEDPSVAHSSGKGEAADAFSRIAARLM
ncbi:septum site-determining protein MinD, partial [Eubacteriales bacterium OttesenSCG-928-N13]|nr:septum site-determining protein MinD [Eubacteriales bacterium OttesenSCG-928-N13]